MTARAIILATARKSSQTVKFPVNSAFERYPAVLYRYLNPVGGNADVALKLMNGIPGNLRIDSLPERFHCNIIGSPLSPRRHA